MSLLKKLKLRSSLTLNHQNKQCTMQPGEANKFSMRSKPGVGGQGIQARKEPAGPPTNPGLLSPDPRPQPPDRVGYLMVLPYILHLAVFLGYALAFAFFLVFHRWDSYPPMKW